MCLIPDHIFLVRVSVRYTLMVGRNLYNAVATKFLILNYYT